MTTERTVYLDHAATTPVAPEVRDAMRPYQSDRFGNPSSAHRLGREAREALERARATVADLLGCRSSEVVFTSGGTEADTLAIVGAALAGRQGLQGRKVRGAGHVTVTAVEHEAVLTAVHFLKRHLGVSSTLVPVDGDGRVSTQAVLDALRPDTLVVSVMLANNEVGTLQPVAEIGRQVQARGITFHTDAAQAGAWLRLDVDELAVDLLSLSGHKLSGPKGSGVLYVRDGTALAPLQAGGGQQRGLRGGTEHVAGAVGLAHALSLRQAELATAAARVAEMRDMLVEELSRVSGVSCTGHAIQRLPNIASFCVSGVRADALLAGLDRRGICASSGSACASGWLEPSHVLTAMGVPRRKALGALRLSLGRETVPADVEAAVAELPDLVARLRAATADCRH